MQFLMLITCLIKTSSDGWTVFAPSPDSRSVYVSSSTGIDTNDGLTKATAKKTIGAAYSRLREGFPDRILLKRGDTFGGLEWEKSGRSDAERMTVSTYGTGDRPIIAGGMFFWGPNMPAGYVLRNLAFQDIDFRGSGPSGRAFMFSGTLQNILLEGCRIDGYRVGVFFQNQPGMARSSGLHFRRNVITNNGEQGLMLNSADDVLLEENVFDFNGRAGSDSVFKHNVYLTEIKGLRISGNIFARGSNFGTKLSADNPGSFTDFVVSNNLYYNNGISLDHSAGPKGDIQTTFTHRNGTIERNVFTELGRAFSATNKQDLVAWLLNSQNVKWSGNIFAHKPVFAGNDALMWQGHHKDITLTGNIVHDWNPVNPNVLGTPAKPWSVDGWAFTGNDINQSAAVYRDASRGVGSYYASIGGTNDAVDFLTAAAQLSKDNWNTQLTANAVNEYIRAGFVRTVVDPTPQPEPTPEPPPVDTRQQQVKDAGLRLLQAIGALNDLKPTQEEIKKAFE